MTIVQKIIQIIIALLSIAAGAAKIMKAPQEIAFFETLGIDLIYMVILGGVQILAGILILIPKVRKIGACLAALAFLVSATMIFKTGQIGFAAVSLLPVALAIYIAISSNGVKASSRV